MAGNHPNYCHSGRPLVTFCCLKVVINGQTIFPPAGEWLGSWRYMGIFCEYESEGIPHHKVAGNLDLPPNFMKTNCCRKKNTKSSLSLRLQRLFDVNMLPKFHGVLLFRLHADCFETPCTLMMQGEDSENDLFRANYIHILTCRKLDVQGFSFMIR